MKKLKTIALALIVALTAVSVTAQTKKIDIQKSTISWVGKKVTGEHSGTVAFKDGTLLFRQNKLVGGTFTVAMQTLTATDLSGEYQQKLNTHLKSKDFFGTDTFPTAVLVFKRIKTKAKNLYTIAADLTIKGITNPVTFDLLVQPTTASTTLVVDRTKYDIKYNSASIFSTIGDKAIADAFQLTVSMQY
ncbi:YceI family protein [Flavobacterium crassostreae]|uniref:Lipid-binding protein n=1 Tax=Flavobacterium crassostreae TaxID=1763534 RepID=A0A1B9E9Z2_9FLAO|nr:YceI family protein [Flavobacterium crassostreae]OCB78753.1 lipid-binding protein [Flavobacterium crassostreae]